MGMQTRLQDLCSQWSRAASKQVNPQIDLDHETSLLQAPVVKFSKYRGVSQKRWCVLTESRIYFFESFSASKFSKTPTEAIPWSRVLFVRYACSAPEKRILTICCRSRLLGIRSVHVDLFGGGDDMDSTWCECFAKLPSVSFFAALERKAIAPSAGKLVREPVSLCAKVEAVDGLSRTSTISTRGSGFSTRGSGLRRVAKMSQIAPQQGEEAASSAHSHDDFSNWHDKDSISTDSIASHAFIEDPDISRCPGLTFRYGKESSSADLCASYQLSKAKGAPSVSTMDSDPARQDADCGASSYLASEIGDSLSDALPDCVLIPVQDI
jgi:hypothetical protein